MDIKEVYGDLFDIAKNHNCDAIAHGCNVDGLMGAGVAKLFREKFPVNYDYYKDICAAAKENNAEIVGSYFGFMDINTGSAIYNMFTQDRPGRYAQLKWVQESFMELCNLDNSTRPKRLAIPKIGCGIGGLEWEDVKMVLEHIKSDTQLVVAYI